jgi:hypothetical protein
MWHSIRQNQPYAVYLRLEMDLNRELASGP